MSSFPGLTLQQANVIIAAALESGCARLLSEDLQNGQVIDNVLTIENPF